MGDDWSREEVAATVSDYFAMLGYELRGESYSKREHNRRLQLLLNGRSAGAIEFKHANISAILDEEYFPYIEGYKPRRNYQERLREAVLSQLLADDRLIDTTAALVTQIAPRAEGRADLSDILVPAPTRESPVGRTNERPAHAAVPRLGVNYLEIEARNTSLGHAGEELVLNLEHQRLWQAGKRTLAERVEHVSRTKGDGLGYDIASFELDGQERLIEVKTTCFGVRTPFFASKREVAVSEERTEHFQLFRVFKFRMNPRVFVLSGAIREHCLLDPAQFRASLR